MKVYKRRERLRTNSEKGAAGVLERWPSSQVFAFHRLHNHY